MGSVIAYDALRLLEREAPDLVVEHLVTVGSPLGLAKVKLKIEAECGQARVPNNVGPWANLADGNDIVAVTGALADDFAPSDAGVRAVDRRVVNDDRRPTGAPNHHKSYGYLRTPEFSRIAARFADPRRLRRACAGAGFPKASSAWADSGRATVTLRPSGSKAISTLAPTCCVSTRLRSRRRCS